MKPGLCLFSSLSASEWCHCLPHLYPIRQHLSWHFQVSCCQTLLSFPQSWTHVHFLHRATEFCCIALCWLTPLQMYKLQPQLTLNPALASLLFWLTPAPCPYSSSPRLSPLLDLLLHPPGNSQQVMSPCTSHGSASQYTCDLPVLPTFLLGQREAGLWACTWFVFSVSPHLESLYKYVYISSILGQKFF